MLIRIALIGLLCGTLCLSGLSSVQAQDGGRLRPTPAPALNFGQVRVAKWRTGGETPTLTIAGHSQKTETRQRAVNVVRLVPEKRTRVILRDGQKVEQQYTVNVPVTVQRIETYQVVVGGDVTVSHLPADQIQAWDLQGNGIEPEKFATVFAKPRHVFLISQPWNKAAPVDAFYRSVLDRNVLFLHLPSQNKPQVKAVPKEVERGKD